MTGSLLPVQAPQQSPAQAEKPLLSTDGSSGTAFRALFAKARERLKALENRGQTRSASPGETEAGQRSSPETAGDSQQTQAAPALSGDATGVVPVSVESPSGPGVTGSDALSVGAAAPLSDPNGAPLSFGDRAMGAGGHVPGVAGAAGPMNTGEGVQHEAGGTARGDLQPAGDPVPLGERAAGESLLQNGRGIAGSLAERLGSSETAGLGVTAREAAGEAAHAVLGTPLSQAARVLSRRSGGRSQQPLASLMSGNAAFGLASAQDQSSPVRGPLSLAFNPDAGGEQQASFAESGAGEVGLDGLASRLIEAVRAAGARLGEVTVGEIAAALSSSGVEPEGSGSDADGVTLLPEVGKSPLDVEAPLHDARDRTAIPWTGALQSEGPASRSEADLFASRLFSDDPAQNAAGPGSGLLSDRAAGSDAVSGSATHREEPDGLTDELRLSQERSAADARGSEFAAALAELEAPVDPPEAAPAQLVRRFEGVTQSSLEQMIRRVDGEVDGEHASLKFQLAPGRLGELELRLEVDRGLVSARFVAASEEVRALIESALPDLRRSLSELGVTVSELSVSVGYEQSGRDANPGREDGVRLSAAPPASSLSSVSGAYSEDVATERAPGALGYGGVDILI